RSPASVALRRRIEGRWGARAAPRAPGDRPRPRGLAHAVGPVVGTEHPVPRPDTGRARDNPRLHELVGLTGFVGAADARDRVGDGLAHAVHHGVVRDLGALPPLVTVHGVIATYDSGNDRGSGFGIRDSGPSESRVPSPA